MTDGFLELTNSDTQDKELIAFGQIARIRSLPGDRCSIEMMTGKVLDFEESYEEVKDVLRQIVAEYVDANG